jgi:hypothetical protein
MIAGLSALPLTASAASLPSPTGSASAAALQLTISLQPLKSIVNTAGGLTGAFDWQTITGELAQLQQVLCGSSNQCPLGLTIPTDLPDSLTVQVAQAGDSATFDSLAKDITAGKSDSTPIATDWKVLNANIANLESLLTSFIDQGTAALASGNVDALTGFLSGVANGSVKLPLGPLGTAGFDLLGTVRANLPLQSPTDKVYDSATAVSVTGIGNGVVPAGSEGFVSVDPFTACAVNISLASKCPSANGAQVSANNTLVSVGLPDLLGTNLDTANLKALVGTLQNLINLLSQAIADPSNAGSILSGAAASLPAPLAGPIGALGGVLSGAAGSVTGATGSTPIDLSALKLWDTKLSDTLATLNALINALANLNLPDITKLVTSADDIATAQTVPMAGGGVASTATSTLGSLSLLPIGGTLSGIIDSAISTSGLPLTPVTSNTALLSVAGIQASAQASVGPNGAGSQSGSAGLRTVSVLGQTIDLDGATSGGVLHGLGPGQEWNHVFAFPLLGANGGTGYLTLDITRGVPQVVADTATYREVHMAALSVSLINGAEGCSTSNCTDPLALGSAGTRAAGTRASSTSNGSGITALGPTGERLAALEAPVSQAAASMVGPVNNPVIPPTGGNQVGLQKTAMFGGNAIPAGLVLIAVAISLRVLPSLRMKLRRVR